MPEQMGAEFEQVMAQCSRGCFTGLLRVRAREGNGEVRFLSGIQDGIRFDSVEGDAALERLLAATEPEFEAISSLPPIDAASSEPVPPEGKLERYHAAQLMRYCESNSLTCALELEVEGRVLTARYRLGELLSVEPDSEHTARLAEAKVGSYRFRLPRFELPAHVQQRRSASVAPKPAPAAAAKPAARSAASLAETPLLGVKAVPVGSPSAGPKSPAVAPLAAKPPVAAPARPAGPSASPPARAAEPRPAAPAPRFESPSNAPPAVVTRREEPRAPAAQPARTEQRPAAAAARTPVAAGVTARPGASSGSAAAPARPALAPSALAPSAPAAAPAPAPASRREEPAAPRAAASQPPGGAASQRKPAQLDGLWVDAVKPPPQSAPLELDSSLQSSSLAGASGRADGLSSLAYKASGGPAKAAPRQRSSALYWLVAVALLLAIAAAGWFLFGR